MKKLLLAVSFVLASTAVHAEGLTFLSGGSATIQGDSNDVTGQGIGTNVGLGFLFANDPEQLVDFTYLGSEAADTNVMTALLLNGTSLFNNKFSSVGDKVYVSALQGGLLDFAFADLTTGGTLQFNGSSAIGYLFSGEEARARGFEFILGFNDNGSSDGDFDDLVVGVNAVPVPAALPLMASALGMFGVARRRKTLA